MIEVDYIYRVVHLKSFHLKNHHGGESLVCITYYFICKTSCVEHWQTDHSEMRKKNNLNWLLKKRGVDKKKKEEKNLEDF